MSLVADRYNGAMLGCFLEAATATSVGERFSALRNRMNEYLASIGSAVVIPESPAAVDRQLAALQKRIAHDLGRAAPALLDAFFVGAGAYLAVVQRPHVPVEAARLWDDVVARLRAIDLPPEIATEYRSRMPDPSRPIEVDRLLSSLLRLVRACIEPLPADADCAFVAMPFSDPFNSRFAELYVPILRELGYRAVRAWGGVAIEDYWELLLTLIRKSGIVLADLTGSNPNVLHEVGLAEGMDKTVLLVMEKDETRLPPSNLMYHAVVQYDLSAPDAAQWTARTVAAAFRPALSARQHSGTTTRGDAPNRGDPR